MRLSKSPYSALALLLLVIGAATGCQNFYLPVASRWASEEERENELQQYIGNNKYFDIRHASGDYAISGIELDRQNQQVKDRLRSLSPEHRRYTNLTSRYRYIKRYGQQVVLNEVHLYMAGDGKLYTSRVVSLPMDSIQKIKVIQLNRGRITSSYVPGAIGIGTGYYQRRVGCPAAGNRHLYIDSEGFVNACPFCHSRSYHVKDLISGGTAPGMVMASPDFAPDHH